MDFREGGDVLGFTLVKEVGSGTHATIWHATKQGHNYALKVPKENGERSVAREAEVWKKIPPHDRVLRLAETLQVKTERGICSVIVTKLVLDTSGRSPSLKALLDEHAAKNASLTSAKWVAFALALLDGVEWLHQNGVVHRDLAPKNILVHENLPLIIDFGSALAGVDAASVPPHSTDGAIVGTPYYLSPESLDCVCHPSVDIWAVSVILYELLTGRLPFQALGDGANVRFLHPQIPFDLAEKIQHADPEPIRADLPIPPGVLRVLERALKKDPQLRFASAKQMRDALAADRVPLSTRSNVSVVQTAWAGSITDTIDLHPLPPVYALLLIKVMSHAEKTVYSSLCSRADAQKEKHCSLVCGGPILSEHDIYALVRGPTPQALYKFIDEIRGLNNLRGFETRFVHPDLHLDRFIGRELSGEHHPTHLVLAKCKPEGVNVVMDDIKKTVTSSRKNQGRIKVLFAGVTYGSHDLVMLVKTPRQLTTEAYLREIETYLPGEHLPNNFETCLILNPEKM